MLKSLIGKTFENEVHLENEVKALIPKCKNLAPVLDGFYVETKTGALYKLFTTSTLGQLTVTEVR